MPGDARDQTFGPGRITSSLHDVLIAKQSSQELERKMKRAKRRSLWTQEDIDYGFRWADEFLKWAETWK